ncbi:MAG: hypothetical protein U1F77_15085 [Kiritimatiellia bacterium]
MYRTLNAALFLLVSIFAGICHGDPKIPDGWKASDYLGRNCDDVASALGYVSLSGFVPEEFTVGNATFRVEASSRTICWVREDLGGWKTIEQVGDQIAKRTGKLPPPPLLVNTGVHATWHLPGMVVQAEGKDPAQVGSGIHRSTTYKSVTFVHRPKMPPRL